MILPYCRHCGGNGFFINGVMRGAVETYYDESGNYEETNMDRAYWESQSKVVRCANCTKIRKDVYYDGKKIVQSVEYKIDPSKFIFRAGNTYEGRK
jgi:hypothetical protein